MIEIRSAHPSDAAVIAAIYGYYVRESVASFEAAPPDAAAIRARMGARPVLPWLVAADGQRVLGYAYASRHRERAAYRWAADCSVYLDPAQRRRGIGRALYERLIAEVSDLGYLTLHAGITLPNAASVRLHESFGFEAVGVFRNVGYKHGRWHDVGWWQRTLRALPATPDEPGEWSGYAAISSPVTR